MPVNNHISEYLDYYCDLKAPDYAVLLSGKWGCGKSHFISQYQEAHKDSRKFIYVSLYGLQNTSQIDDAFFEQLHPILSSKGMDIAGKVVKATLRATFRFDLDGDKKSDGSVQLKLPDSIGFLNDSKDHILIFDDLERCCMPIAHVLGYINSFVEHHDRHVILIADESKIKSKKTYALIKEKLIGQPFKVHADIDDAIDVFCPKVSNDICRKFLIKNKDFIRNLFAASEYNNLRALKKIIQDFSHIFEILPSNAQDKKGLLLNMLGALAVISFEMRCGKVSVKDIGKLLNEPFSIWRGKKGGDNDRFSKIQNKYQAFYVDESTPDSSLWKDYVKLGTFDAEVLQNAILNSTYFQDENTPNWIRLWHGLDLDDNTFEKARMSVEQSLKNREYKKVPVIKHVFGHFLWMAQKGLYNKNEKDVVAYFHAYIDALIANDELELIEEAFMPSNDSYAGLGYFSRGDSLFNEFCAYLEMELQKVKEASYPEQAEELLVTMKSDIRLFYRRLCPSNSGDTKYDSIPILKYVTPEQFIEAFKIVPAKERLLLANVFKERYKFNNKLLVEELEWLESVKELLSAEAEVHKGKITAYVFQHIIDDGLSPAITNLQSASESVE